MLCEEDDSTSNISVHTDVIATCRVEVAFLRLQSSHLVQCGRVPLNRFLREPQNILRSMSPRRCRLGWGEGGHGRVGRRKREHSGVQPHAQGRERVLGSMEIEIPGRRGQRSRDGWGTWGCVPRGQTETATGSAAQLVGNWQASSASCDPASLLYHHRRATHCQYLTETSSNYRKGEAQDRRQAEAKHKSLSRASGAVRMHVG